MESFTKKVENRRSGNKMISYIDFIKRMEEKGFVHKNNLPIMLDENSQMVKTFILEKGETGKILELTCPENTVISLCGDDLKTDSVHSDYTCTLKCFDHEGNEPFLKDHKGYILYVDPSDNRPKGSAIDIVITKVVKDEQAKNIAGVNNCLQLTESVMRLIKSDNPLEYPMIVGIYQKITEYLTMKSFNLYPTEKMIFYALEPDINITKVKFEIIVDIFEIKKPEELLILDKDKIVDVTRSDYRSVIKIEV